MRIVFFGASDIGSACCEALLRMGEEVVGIVSTPPTFRLHRAAAPVTNVRFRSFEPLAEPRGIPVFSVADPQAQAGLTDRLARLRPDLLVVIGWYFMLPAFLRAVAPLGAVGIHASLLPKYRGGAPLVWAMIRGEIETGVSLFHLADGVDDGDLIAQARIPILEGDAIGDVIARAQDAAVGLVRAYVPLVADGRALRQPQDHRAATMMPQRRPEDGATHWQAQSARDIYNWIRAQSHPYPGAWTTLGEGRVTLWNASLAPGARAGALPGTLIPSLPGAPDACGVVCADGGMIQLHEIGLEDGSTLTGAEFAARSLTTDLAFGRPMARTTS